MWERWKQQGKWAMAVGGVLLLVGFVIWAVAPSDRQAAAFYPALLGLVSILAGGVSHLYYSAKLLTNPPTGPFKTCDRCGKQIPFESAFCMHCGNRTS